ncbi:Fc.00g059300.m01.CDS01 [Cosmosporella sp. VM-42]
MSSHPHITRDDHEAYMRYALDQARLSPPGPSKFCVGAVLVDADTNEVLGTGFSMELPGYMPGDMGNTHAEQCCFMKVAARHNLPVVHSEDHIHQALSKNIVLYTTMEPCNERLSGHTTCVERILKLKDHIKAVYIGIREPNVFIRDNAGIPRLEEVGILVRILEHMHDEIMEVSTAGHNQPAQEQVQRNEIAI